MELREIFCSFSQTGKSNLGRNEDVQYHLMFTSATIPLALIHYGCIHQLLEKNVEAT